MIMSMPKDAAWPDSVIDSHRKVNHHATHRHPRPAATTRRPSTHRRRPRTPGGARRPRDAVRRDPSTPIRRADGRPRRRYPHRRCRCSAPRRELATRCRRQLWSLRIARRRRRHHGQATHSSAVVTAVRTGITGLADALVSASVVLTAAIICAGAAGADPSQQDQFVALLEQEQIPPVDDGEVAGVVARAHQICGEVNGGTPVDTLVNDEMDRGYADNPRLHLYPDRVRRTAVRFITASVDVYCPSHQGELPPYE